MAPPLPGGGVTGSLASPKGRGNSSTIQTYKFMFYTNNAYKLPRLLKGGAKESSFGGGGHIGGVYIGPICEFALEQVFIAL